MGVMTEVVESRGPAPVVAAGVPRGADGPRFRARELRLRDLRPQSGRRLQLRDLALAEIERSLTDPDLSAALVAARIGISSRYLHVLFADHGLSVGRWIRQRRLESSWGQLLGAGAEAPSISEVAAANGFRDPSYFTRAFKSQFGMTPTEAAALKRGLTGMLSRHHSDPGG